MPEAAAAAAAVALLVVALLALVLAVVAPDVVALARRLPAGVPEAAEPEAAEALRPLKLGPRRQQRR